MLTVIGDYMYDNYSINSTVGKCVEGDFPILKFLESKKFNGGAGMVADLVEGLGREVIRVGADIKQRCIKNRLVVDDKIVYRFDFDNKKEINSSQERQILADIPPETSYVLLADYGKGIVTHRLYQSLIERYKVIVDPAKIRELSWYSGAFAIIPNRVEAKVTSIEEAILCCESLLDDFANVCIKLDKDGMIISTDSGYEHISSITKNCVDVCGAGDAVLAGIGAYLDQGISWKEACLNANIVAGKKCEILRWKM